TRSASPSRSAGGWPTPSTAASRGSRSWRLPSSTPTSTRAFFISTCAWCRLARMSRLIGCTRSICWLEITMDIFDLINDEIARALGRIRKGFYIARVSSPSQTYRRAQIVPEWLVEGALDNVRRIASPILDVIPAAGARMAILSQDGVPELGAVMGQVWD